jgi:hypothetical protein
MFGRIAVEPMKLAAQPPAANAAPKKAVAKPAAKSPAVSKAVASKDAVPAGTTAMESRAVAASRQDEESIATTITGCLVMRDDGMFQLKDTDGEHAPKSRSWKSGFIKKGSASIDVFDAGNRLALASHLHYRVSVSGTLTDRQLRARAMRATSESCD